MHKTEHEVEAFLSTFLPAAADGLGEVDVVLCPPFTSLRLAAERCAETGVRVAAQNMHFEPQGPFTGEISPPMLADVGADAVILGHSERRRLFGESDEALGRKVPAAIAANLMPILCVGETLEEREAGATNEVLRRQLEADLAGVEDKELARVAVAYEPVWAIGTGRTATVDQAAEAIGFIRELISARDPGAGEGVRVVYGGSVTPANAEALLRPAAIDGALVGGASLDPGDFLTIASAA
jgi:triosephosphate isomerase